MALARNLHLLASLARVLSTDETAREPALPPQPIFDAAHAAVVSLVVIAKQMKQAVERKDLHLGRFGVSRIARLAPRDPAGDDDLAEETLRWGWIGKAENVCRVVRAPVPAVQRANATVAHQRDAHGAARLRRGDAAQPRGETRRRHPPA